jgi:alanyl-tRNA synthetase
MAYEYLGHYPKQTLKPLEEEQEKAQVFLNSYKEEKSLAEKYFAKAENKLRDIKKIFITLSLDIGERNKDIIKDLHLIEIRVSELKALSSELSKELRKLRKLAEKADLAINAESTDDLLASAETIGSIQFLAKDFPGKNIQALQKILDTLKQKESGIVAILAGVDKGKVQLAVGLGKGAIDQGYSAGDLVKKVAPIIGGSGGGRPGMAMAGGKQPENLNKLFEEARKLFLT